MNKIRLENTSRRCMSSLMILLILMLNGLPLKAAEELPEPAQAEENGTAANEPSGLNNFVQTSGKPFLAGDGLWVSTFPDTTSFLNQTFPIDDGGYVTFPLVGKIQVSQMSEEQLVTFIKKNFEVYSRSPNVEVKPMLRLSMIGGFLHPGLYYVDYNLSIWNTLQLSGGPLLEDGIEKLIWERDGEPVKDDLSFFIQKGISLKNMGFKSGDIVWTPSPAALTTWDIVVRDVLPIMAFATTIFMVWITYQQMIIYSQTR